MANGQGNLEQWTAPQGADQAIYSSREGGQGALLDEYLQMAVNRPHTSPRPLADSHNTDSHCVKNAGQTLLPQLDIECLQAKRDVIDRHGAEIWYEREKAAHRAFFRFVLPVATPEAEAATPDATPVAGTPVTGQEPVSALVLLAW